MLVDFRSDKFAHLFPLVLQIVEPEILDRIIGATREDSGQLCPTDFAEVFLVF